MNSKNRQLPRTVEEQTVINRSRQDARRGGLVGALVGAAGGRLLLRKRKLAGASAGAIGGALIGNAVGREEGLRSGARDVLGARRVLKNDMEALTSRLVELEERQRDRDQARMIARARQAIEAKYGPHEAEKLSDDDILDLLDEENDPDLPLATTTISKLPGVYSDARRTLNFRRENPNEDGSDWHPEATIARDGLGNANQAKTGALYPQEFSPTAARMRIWRKYGAAIAQSLPDDQLDDAHAEALAAMIGQKLRDGNAGGRHSVDPAVARKFFARKMGEASVQSMGDAEVVAHYMSARREGLVELESQGETTDFYSDRARNGAGEFVDESRSDAPSIQRAYSPDPRQRRSGVAVAGAAGGAAVIGAALLAHKRLRKARVPKLANGKTLDIDARRDFAARNLAPSPFGGPRKLIRRPRRGGKLLARLRAFGVGGSLAASLVDGVVDAVGIGSATNPKKKKLVPKYDADGNPIIPLQDPPVSTTSSFSAAGNLVRSARPLARDAGVIAGADLLADRLNAAIERRKKRRQSGGDVEATPGLGGAPQTMASIHDVLTEFADGSRERARKRAEALGATAGASAGALAGLRYESGEPVRPRDLKPGDRVHKRFGPGGLFEHEGIVGEDGRITHRTRGSATYRSVKPGSFAKTGRGRMYRETPSPDDLPASEAAKNATRAAGTRAGKYCAGSNDCQTAVDRLASRRSPFSKQARRALGGAAGGAAVGAAIASLLARKKDNQ